MKDLPGAIKELSKLILFWVKNYRGWSDAKLVRQNMEAASNFDPFELNATFDELRKRSNQPGPKDP